MSDSTHFPYKKNTSVDWFGPYSVCGHFGTQLEYR